MHVSQRLDYALRAAVLLAARPADAFVSGAEIAARLGLPQRVVEQQLSALARSGVLRSKPGSGGGHALARPASQITVADVMKAVQGFVLDVPKMRGSVASEVWSDASGTLETHFDAITLESLAERQARADAAGAGHYTI